MNRGKLLIVEHKHAYVWVVAYLIACGASAGAAGAAAEIHRGSGQLSTRPGRQISSEPLEAIGQSTPRETDEVDAALAGFAKRTSRDDFSALTDFLAGHPHSAWRVSLLTQMGDEYYRTGHFSKALEAWETVWAEARPGSTNAPPALCVQHSAASLAGLYARLGRMEPLRQLLAETEGLPMMGEYASRLKDARDGLWTMDHRPEIAFRCGPLALGRLLAWPNRTNGCSPLIFNSKSTTNGICLRDVARLARDLGMDYQIAFRSPGAEVIVPAVIHWKVGHYAAIVREARGLFLTQDPTFWNDTWASQPTLDEEASGYFLVPSGRLPQGWRAVSQGEAARVWGKGTTQQSDKDGTSERDDKLKDNQCHGMAVWDFNLMLINQRIMDTPIGYQPPVGPAVYFKFTMSAQDNWMRQFASWWGTTLGENWSCNWNSFIQDDPSNPSANLRVYDQGGWLTFIEDPAQPGTFRCQFRNPGYITVLTLNGNDVGYTWNLPDGGRKIYGSRYAANGTSLGYALMTAVVDAAGNAVTLEYDPVFAGRINAIVDAIGQRTTLEYGLSDPGYPPPSPISQGNVQFNWQVTKITDPFGRSATFQYEVVQDGGPPAYFYYLTNITDVAGLSSQMRFYPGWAQDSFPCLPSLTTPYGTTRFRSFVLANRDFGFEITDPDGNVERLQYAEDARVNVPASELLQNVPQGMTSLLNDWLFSRNVYYWSKKAYAEGFATNDYSKAVIYHFTHADNLTATGPILESIKRPLENRVWFNYPGQGGSWVPGNDDHPSKIGRVLDDGTTQLWQFGWNSLGNVTNSIDPIGRTFSFIYDTNEIDLLEVRQTRNRQNELMWKATYNNQHLPLTVTDAAGQATALAYNTRGQLLTAVNARNETNSFGYDANGYLTSMDGPLPGTQDRYTFTYDAAGHMHTATDQDGYSVTLGYDNLDRLTTITFPDGTFEQITYDRLKPGTVRDRLGRITTYTYDSLQQLVSIQDPLGRLTRFQWCRCGELEALIDPLGRMTSWQRDIQGRITAKQFADGTSIHYDYEHTTSRLRNIRDEQNQITQFDYYADDSLKRRSYPNALVATPAVLFTYDPDYLRLATMQDGQGVTAYRYYPILTPPSLGAGRLASIDGPWANDTITYEYDELGRVAAQVLNGAAERRQFDAAMRPVSVTNLLGTFLYNWEGGSKRLSSIQYPNGQRSVYTYHPNIRDQRLKSITHYLPDNSVLSQFTYGYDVASRITNWVQLQGGVSKTWLAAYDDADRLTAVTVSQGGTPVQAFQYAYDAADNRTVEIVDSNRSEYSYNARNLLTSISNSPLPAISYEWDAENRLVAINIGTHRTQLTYDGYGRYRRAIESDGGIVSSEKSYLWCGGDLCEERDATGANTLQRFYFKGQLASAGARLAAGSYFYTGDHLGSVRELVDSNGAVRAEYIYEPFGRFSRLAGDLDADFNYSLHFYHPASQLHWTLYRAYSTALARWLSPDPVGERARTGKYTYVSNNPLNLLDPDGRAGTSINFYNGLGGGVFTKSGQDGSSSAGFELGVGKGGGLEYDPAAQPEIKGNFWDDDQLTIQADIGASYGPFSGKLSLNTKSCTGDWGAPKAKFQFCILFVCGDTSGGITSKIKVKEGVKGIEDFVMSSLKVGVSGKAGIKYEVPTTDFTFFK